MQRNKEVSSYNNKTDKNNIHKKINEDGIGSNFKTIDTDPISFFHDARVEVEIFPDAWGNTSVQITCPEIGYNSGLRTFEDESQAELFARNQYSDLIGKLDSKIVESIMQRLLKISRRQ
tara:strand:+ start:190 stop:546 length:357 start_codon:yes stop_codon:yes gene_type:complete